MSQHSEQDDYSQNSFENNHGDLSLNSEPMEDNNFQIEYEFVEETLQITDVQEVNMRSTVLEPLEIRADCLDESSVMTTYTVDSLINTNSNLAQNEELDLQSELADLLFESFNACIIETNYDKGVNLSQCDISQQVKPNLDQTDEIKFEVSINNSSYSHHAERKAFDDTVDSDGLPIEAAISLNEEVKEDSIKYEQCSLINTEDQLKNVQDKPIKEPNSNIQSLETGSTSDTSDLSLDSKKYIKEKLQNVSTVDNQSPCSSSEDFYEALVECEHVSTDKTIYDCSIVDSKPNQTCISTSDKNLDHLDVFEDAIDSIDLAYNSNLAIQTNTDTYQLNTINMSTEGSSISIEDQCIPTKDQALPNEEIRDITNLSLYNFTEESSTNVDIESNIQTQLEKQNSINMSFKQNTLFIENVNTEKDVYINSKDTKSIHLANVETVCKPQEETNGHNIFSVENVFYDKNVQNQDSHQSNYIDVADKESNSYHIIEQHKHLTNISTLEEDNDIVVENNTIYNENDNYKPHKTNCFSSPFKKEHSIDAATLNSHLSDFEPNEENGSPYVLFGENKISPDDVFSNEINQTNSVELDINKAVNSKTIIQDKTLSIVTLEDGSQYSITTTSESKAIQDDSLPFVGSILKNGKGNIYQNNSQNENYVTYHDTHVDNSNTLNPACWVDNETVHHKIVDQNSSLLCVPTEENKVRNMCVASNTTKCDDNFNNETNQTSPIDFVIETDNSEIYSQNKSLPNITLNYDLSSSLNEKVTSQDEVTYDSDSNKQYFEGDQSASLSSVKFEEEKMDQLTYNIEEKTLENGIESYKKEEEVIKNISLLNVKRGDKKSGDNTHLPEKPIQLEDNQNNDADLSNTINLVSKDQKDSEFNIQMSLPNLEAKEVKSDNNCSSSANNFELSKTSLTNSAKNEVSYDHDGAGFTVESQQTKPVYVAGNNEAVSYKTVDQDVSLAISIPVPRKKDANISCIEINETEEDMSRNEESSSLEFNKNVSNYTVKETFHPGDQHITLSTINVEDVKKGKNDSLTAYENNDVNCVVDDEYKQSHFIGLNDNQSISSEFEIQHIPLSKFLPEDGHIGLDNNMADRGTLPNNIHAANIADKDNSYSYSSSVTEKIECHNVSGSIKVEFSEHINIENEADEQTNIVQPPELTRNKTNSNIDFAYSEVTEVSSHSHSHVQESEIATHESMIWNIEDNIVLEASNGVLNKSSSDSPIKITVNVSSEGKEGGKSGSFFERESIHDMSITLINDSAFNQVSSNVGSHTVFETKESPSHIDLSCEKVTDFTDIKDVNSFTSLSDQKVCDAVYLPIYERNENSNLTITGAPSLMEMTLANTNPVMLEQSFVSNYPSKESNFNCLESISYENNSDNQIMNVSLSGCDLESNNLNVSKSSSDSQHNSDISLKSTSHKEMQQSMSDYVTNHSLKLAIPECDQQTNFNHTNDELSQQCEIQTKNVLLMKWPIQFYEQLKALKEQNIFLLQELEYSRHNELYITNLKQDNEELSKKFDDMKNQADDLFKQNCLLKDHLRQIENDKDVIIQLQHKNDKLVHDLESLKTVEMDLKNINLINKNLSDKIENITKEKEEDIEAMEKKIEELQCELNSRNEAVTKLCLENENLSKLVINLNEKESQINFVLQDKIILQDNLSKISSEFNDFSNENQQLKVLLELEKEKYQKVEDLNKSLEDEIHKIFIKNEELSKVVCDVNEKELQIKTLFQEKLNLEETIINLKNNLENLSQVKTENGALIVTLSQEKEKFEHLEMSNRSMEEQLDCLRSETEKLNLQLVDKENEIKLCLEAKATLEEEVVRLNSFLTELENKNEQLKCCFEKEKQKAVEIEKMKDSYEEQILTLNSQNELLWNELKVSTTKEKSLYCLKEEKLMLEEKLVLMKREFQEFNNLKLENQRLIEELNGKDCEILNLIADKKKLKSSLIKANDKLNHLDSENEYLQGELNAKTEELNINIQTLMENSVAFSNDKNQLQNQIDTLLRKEKELNNYLENERVSVTDCIGQLSEYISSLLFEKDFLTQQSNLNEKLKETCDYLVKENNILKENISKGVESNNSLLIEKHELESKVDDLKNNIDAITFELDSYKNRCCDLTNTMEKNKQLCLQVRSLEEQIHTLENEKEFFMEDLSSLSETIGSLFFEREFLFKKLMDSNKKNEQILQLSKENDQLAQEVIDTRKVNQSLVLELDGVKQKVDDRCDVEELVVELENHVSSLNEELMSEITKYHSLTMINEDLQSKNSQMLEEKLELKSFISMLEHKLQNIQSLSENSKESQLKLIQVKEDIIKDLNLKLESLQTSIDVMTEKITGLESENYDLNKNILEIQERVKNLQIDNQNLSDALEPKRDLELKYNSILEEKFELESKLESAMNKSLQINYLEKENQRLTEINQNNGEKINSLQDEKTNIELQFESLQTTFEQVNEGKKVLENLVKESSQLKETMIQEIRSLTGLVKDFDSYALLDVYKTLMAEFLNKEKEVIFALQNECETKITTNQDEIVNLQNIIEEKEVLNLKLGNDIEELKNQIICHDAYILELKNNLKNVEEELELKGHDISEIKQLLLQTETEKASLLSQLINIQNIESMLQEKVSYLNTELNKRDKETIDLKSEIDKLKYLELEMKDCSEQYNNRLIQQQETINELTSKLNQNEELFSELNLQLQNNINEINQLNKALEIKNRENEENCLKIDELAATKINLNRLENEIEVINQCFDLMGEDFDGEMFLETTQNCKTFTVILKLIYEKWTSFSSKLQSHVTKLQSQLADKTVQCKSLETQINCLNEELKAHKILYDEDLLQSRETLSAKNNIITDLQTENEKLKLETADAQQKIDNFEKQIKELSELQKELNKLKEENAKLSEGFGKFNLIVEINKKLSLEIEELSRSLKFEKQCNTDLKMKCDIVNNHLTDLKKKNFSLEDKIELLENKLQNHDIIDSIHITFPYETDTVDKRVKYINENLAEVEKLKIKLESLSDEHNTIKLEYEKNKEYIKKQEEKLSKILKRELELKKQIASSVQLGSDNKILEEVKSGLLSLFPGESISLLEAVARIKKTYEECKAKNNVDSINVEELKKKVEEVTQENKDLDYECEMMHKHIKEQEELLATVLKREEELKNTNETLKEKLSASQEEYSSLDKECEDMFKAYQEKEKDLADVLKREAETVSEMQLKQEELEAKLKCLTSEVQAAKSEQSFPSASCQCDELKSRLTELKIDLADRNAKITGLELQLEADNFPLKKKAGDLEKSLEQAKYKINELKAEVRRYQEQMHEVTVGLRPECERCRKISSSHQEFSMQTSPVTSPIDISEQLAQKNKEISILKALCKSRNKKIAELEQKDRTPRQLRSALKEGKENTNIPKSPSKGAKGNL